MMKGNYDNSAYFYDRLSQLVFGRSLIKAQVYLLQHIPASSSVLIVGGGSGWILEEITRRHPSGLNITYVELSGKMMTLSRKRDTGHNQVKFINKGIEEVKTVLQDIIITPFLFDNFTDKKLAGIFDHIHHLLRPGGLWFNTDFQLTGKWWQYILLKSMLLFFKILCGVESWRLPDVKGRFNEYNYQTLEDKTFYSDFIITSLYSKPE